MLTRLVGIPNIITKIGIISSVLKNIVFHGFYNNAYEVFPFSIFVKLSSIALSIQQILRIDWYFQRNPCIALFCVINFSHLEVTHWFLLSIKPEFQKSCNLFMKVNRELAVLSTFWFEKGEFYRQSWRSLRSWFMTFQAEMTTKNKLLIYKSTATYWSMKNGYLETRLFSWYFSEKTKLQSRVFEEIIDSKKSGGLVLYTSRPVGRDEKYFSWSFQSIFRKNRLLAIH